MAHTVVDDIHELQLLALTAGRRVVLPDGHGFRFLFLFPGLEHWESKLHAHLVVALPKFLKLFLCDMQLTARIEVNRVDEEMRVDVLPVSVGADQNFEALVVLGQLQRRRVSGVQAFCGAKGLPQGGFTPPEDVKSGGAPGGMAAGERPHHDGAHDVKDVHLPSLTICY